MTSGKIGPITIGCGGELHYFDGIDAVASVKGGRVKLTFWRFTPEGEREVQSWDLSEEMGRKVAELLQLVLGSEMTILPVCHGPLLRRAGSR